MTLKMCLDNGDCEKHQPPTECVIVSAAPTSGSGADRSSQRSKRIILVGAAAVVVVAVLILVGVLVGYKIMADHADNAIRHSFEWKTADLPQLIREDVSVHLTENTTVFHTRVDGSDVWTANDFNKQLQVTKVVRPSEGTICYVNPLNTSQAALPQQLVDVNQYPVAQQVKQSPKVFLSRLSSCPVADKSFLGAISKSLCDNIPLYWVTQTTRSDVGRYKRGSGCCYYTCSVTSVTISVPSCGQQCCC